MNIATLPKRITPASSVDVAEHYIGSQTFADYRNEAEQLFPFILDLIDPKRVTGSGFQDYVALMNEISGEFEDRSNGGRGEAYNFAQKNSDNRAAGMTFLLKLFSVSGQEMAGKETIILDALGGDGTIARFLKEKNIAGPTIISADLSSFMVNACLAQGLPCIRQSADQSLLRDGVLDGVFIGYGAHHLDAQARQDACHEAFRTLKSGGRFVLHDFEEGGSTAQWFNKVVHPFSRTGHDYPHFSQDEMQQSLEKAGFENISVFRMPDPFTLKGGSAQIARENALMHLYHMYDLVKITGTRDEILSQMETHTRNTLGEIRVERTGTGYIATVPRQALVAVGTKATLG